MRNLLTTAAVLATLALLGCAANAPQPEEPAPAKPAPATTQAKAATATATATAAKTPAQAPARVLALKFYADWCPVCRRIKPKVAAIEHRFASGPVKFIVFDFTNKNTTAQAAARAHAMKLSSVYGRFAPGTGFVVLVDAHTRRLVSVLTAKQTKAQWIAAVRSAVARDRAGS